MTREEELLACCVLDLVKDKIKSTYSKEINRVHSYAKREEEIIKASREYAMNKSNERDTYFVDYKDIEEAFLEGAKFAFAYSTTSNNTERRNEI